MNNTQNEKIKQVSDTALVIDARVRSQFSFAKAFDNKGKELTIKVISFPNSIEGFSELIGSEDQDRE